MARSKLLMLSMPAVHGGQAVTPWYLAGGVAKATCLAAYQAIGAASLAESYVNLANPGTYNLSGGVAPTWAAETGWTFDGSSQYKLTGITPAAGAAQTMSMIARLLRRDREYRLHHGLYQRRSGLLHHDAAPVWPAALLERDRRF